MAAYPPNFPRGDSHSFQKIADAFLAGESLPFAEVLSAERIERIFQKHGCLFGLHGAYTTAIMVWSFLSQVLRDGKEASCQAAVAGVVSYCQIQGLQTPTEDIEETLGFPFSDPFRPPTASAATVNSLAVVIQGIRRGSCIFTKNGSCRQRTCAIIRHAQCHSFLAPLIDSVMGLLNVIEQS